VGVAAAFIGWSQIGPNLGAAVWLPLAASAIVLGSAFNRHRIWIAVLVALVWFCFAALVALTLAYV
jgi:hypothetical protein